MAIFLKKYAPAIGLGLITLGLYLPSLWHSFVAYDDQQYVTENPVVRAGLTLKGVSWAFGYHASNWHPVAWLSHMLDSQIYGLNPAGHHLTSISLHVANTLLLLVLLNQMTGARWRSAAVAALFGWHPLHVEAVAWVAERKELLSTFFSLLSLWAYVHSKRRVTESHKTGSVLFYAASLMLFALALMSKPMAVTLPFVLLLLDYWPLGQFSNNPLQVGKPALDLNPPDLSRAIFQKWPFFVLTLIACILTVQAQQRGFAIVSQQGLPFGTRLQHALLAYGHYLAVMLVPRQLSVYYPYEPAPAIGNVLLSALVLVGLSALALRSAVRRPYFVVGWLWFLGTLVPVIGLVQVGDQAWADRYTYFPLIGLFVAVVWAVADLAQTYRWPKPAVCLPVAWLALLLPLTCLQLRHWKDTRTLFEHANQVTRHNQLAITLLGSLLAKEGKTDEAIEHYRRAISYSPNYPEAHFFLGIALEQQGKLEQAMAEYQKALASKAIQQQTHVLLGAALARKGEYEKAAAHYLAALKIDPQSAAAHNNFARMLQFQGRVDEAILHYSAAIQFDPNPGPAHNNLGILLLQKGDLAGALVHLRQAVRLQPDNPETSYNLALALNQQGNWSQAAEAFGRIIRIMREDANAHYQFGLALAHLGKAREAMSQFASALLLKPDFPDALDRLSWILATATEPELRNGTEAVRMAEHACELAGQTNAAKLATLAAAYAEAGRFDDATSTIQKALRFDSKGISQLPMQRLLESFQSHQPWRESQKKSQ